MKAAAVLLLAAVPIAFPPGAAKGGSPPPGATARCRDGTYSYSQHHAGACSHHRGVATWLEGQTSATGGAASPASSSPSGKGSGSINLGETVLLKARTKTSGCKLGPLPDRRCSPGAYYSGLTKAVLCSSSFRTSSVRNVPDSEKHQIEVEYGLAPKGYGSTLEVDHILSLEIGGSNDIANLYPEEAVLPGHAPGFHVKDKLENKLHDLVCAGQMTLSAAQQGIASNWEALYRRVFGFAPEG